MENRRRIIGSKLVHDGYLYTRLRRCQNTKNYWDCQRLRQKLCTSRVVTVGDGDHVQIFKHKPHEHAPDRELVEAEVIKYIIEYIHQALLKFE